MGNLLLLPIAIHWSLSFWLTLLGGAWILGKSAFLSLFGLALWWGVAIGILRFTLPLFAQQGKLQNDGVRDAITAATAANYAVFLLMVGLAKKVKVSPTWMELAFGFAVLQGLLIWSVGFVRAQRKDKEIRNHQAALAEARRLLELDAPKDAEDRLKESLLATEVTFGELHLQSAQAAIDLARFYQETSQREKAAAMFLRAKEVRRQILGADHISVGSTIMEWVAADDSLEPGEAIRELRLALLVLEKQLGPYAAPVAVAYERIGQLHQSQSQWGEAETALRRSLSILKQAESQLNRDQFRVALSLCQCYLQQSKTVDCEQICRELENLSSSQPPAMQLEFLSAQMDLAQAQNDPAQVSEKGWQCLLLLRSELGPEARQFKAVWDSCLERLAEPFCDPEASGLLAATFSGDSFTVRKAMEAHPDWVHQVDSSGWTLVQWASFFGHERLVESFLGAGISVDEVHDEWPPFHIACRWGHRRLISNLSAKVASQNQVARGGWSPVMRCAENGDNRLLDLLTSKELEIDAVNERGDSALLMACRKGHYNFAVSLVSRGADVNRVNPNSGRTPLHEAAYIGHRAIAECLLLNGANVEARDRTGMTAADLADQAEKGEVARYIQAFARGSKV